MIFQLQISEKVSNFLKAGVFFLLLTVLSSCSLLGAKPTAFESLISTPEGVSAEQMLPEEVFALVSVNRISEGQRAKAATLAQKFSKYEFMRTLIIDFLNKEMTPFGIDYAGDIQPMLGEGSRAVFAVANRPQNSMDVNVQGTNLNYYLALYIADELKYQEFQKALQDSGAFETEEYKGGIILVEPAKAPESLFFVKYKDVLIGGNGYESAKSLIEKGRANRGNLLQKKHFVKVTANLASEHTGFGYFDMDAYRERLKTFFKKPVQSNDGLVVEDVSGDAVGAVRVPEDVDSGGDAGKDSGREDQGSSEKKITNADNFVFFADALAGAAIAIAGNSGFEITSSKLFEGSEDWTGRERYLLNDMPGRDMIMYLEGYDLKSGLMSFFEIMKSRSADFSRAYDFVKQAFQSVTQQSFEEDFLGWMNQGFAIALQNNGNKIVPGISLVIDAASNPEKAREFVARLDAQIDEYIVSLKAESEEYAKAITKGLVEVGDSKLYSVEIDFNQLKLRDIGSGFNTIPLSLFSENVLIYYGMTSDNRFVISTYQRFAGDYGKEVLAENKEFDDFSGVVREYPFGLFYGNMKELIRYLETYIAFYETLGYETSARDMEATLNFLREDLQAVKGLIWADRRNGTMLEGKGFLRVEGGE